MKEIIQDSSKVSELVIGQENIASFLSIKVDNSELKEQNIVLSGTISQLEIDLQEQKKRLNEYQLLIQQKLASNKQLEQRYSPEVLSKMLDGMAENFHSNLESQAELFCSAPMSNSVLTSSTLLGTTSISDTQISSGENSMITDSLATTSTSLPVNLQHFVTKWYQERVQYHVYQLKAKSLYNLAFPVQAPPNTIKPQSIATNPPQSVLLPQPQAAIAPPQQTKSTGFGFRNFWS